GEIASLSAAVPACFSGSSWGGGFFMDPWRGADSNAAGHAEYRSRPGFGLAQPSQSSAPGPLSSARRSDGRCADPGAPAPSFAGPQFHAKPGDGIFRRRAIHGRGLPAISAVLVL